MRMGCSCFLVPFLEPQVEVGLQSFTFSFQPHLDSGFPSLMALISPFTTACAPCRSHFSRKRQPTSCLSPLSLKTKGHVFEHFCTAVQPIASEGQHAKISFPGENINALLHRRDSVLIPWETFNASVICIGSICVNGSRFFEAHGIATML